MGESAKTLAPIDSVDPTKYVVLHPIVAVREQAAQSPLLVESLSMVQIATDPQRKEIYHDYRFANAEKGDCALSSLGLNKIAQAAGIKWDLDRCEITKWDVRPDGHIVCAYRAVAAVRQPNGEWQVEPATKVIDTAVEAEELEETYRRKLASGRARFTEAEIPGMVKREVLQLKRFLSGHAETKAKSRVIRSLLSLQQTYPKKVLDTRPFMVPRLLFRPDLADPLQLEAMQAGGRRAVSELYGPPSLPSRGTSEGSEPPDASGSPAAEPASVGDAAISGSGPNLSEGEAVPSSARPAPERQAPAAGPEASGAPEPPKDDPMFEEGPHKGERYSYVTEIDRGYMEGVAQHGRTKVLRELAAAWVRYTFPNLGDAS